jgi:predicted MFS family arabinose efflux permease
MWRVSAPFIAGYFVSYVYRMVNAVLAPTLVAEFGLGAGQLGLLSSMYFLSFALTQLPLGVAMDRFGPRRVNASLLLVAAIGGWLFSRGQTFEELALARALIGLGVSVSLMASLTAFVLWYPPERISTMNGLAFAAGALGAMTATVPLELLLRTWPWRDAFLLIVAATVAVSLVLWFWVPERRAHAADDSLLTSVRELKNLLVDAAFLRLALCVGASQCAAVALQTLWIATWLRDVGGYSPAGVARGLLAVNVAMIVGYVGFGRAADRWHQRGRDPIELLLGGVAASAASLGLVVFGYGSLVIWCLFVGAGTSVVLGYAILSQRMPRGMAGRANTALNVVAFVGMFSGQWGIGLVLDRWPQVQAAHFTGYAPEAYPWALGMVWAVQLAGLAWLWAGRAVLGK